MKPFFFHFFSFWPLLLHLCITFSFLVQIERFKLLWNHHLKLYKSSSNSKGNRLIFKDFLRGSKIVYEIFHWKFSAKNTLPYLGGGGDNFLSSSSFLSIFSAIDAPRGGLHLVFGHHKQWGPSCKITKSKLYLKSLLMGCSTLIRHLKPCRVMRPRVFFFSFCDINFFFQTIDKYSNLH
jgi:hypothetical protein